MGTPGRLFQVFIFSVGLRDVPRLVREGTSLSDVPLVYENIPKEAILALYFNIYLYINIIYLFTG